MRYKSLRRIVEKYAKSINLAQPSYIWIQPFYKPLKVRRMHDVIPKLTWRAIVGVDVAGGVRFYILRGYQNEVICLEDILPAWGFYSTGAPMLSNPRRSLERSSTL